MWWLGHIRELVFTLGGQIRLYIVVKVTSFFWISFNIFQLGTILFVSNFVVRQSGRSWITPMHLQRSNIRTRCHCGTSISILVNGAGFLGKKTGFSNPTGDWKTRFQLLGRLGPVESWAWCEFGVSTRYLGGRNRRNRRKKRLIAELIGGLANILHQVFRFLALGIDAKHFARQNLPDLSVYTCLCLYTGEGTGKLVSFEKMSLQRHCLALNTLLAKQPLNNKRCSTAFSAVPVHTFVINTMQHILQIFQSSQVHDSTHNGTGWQRVTQVSAAWLQVYIDNQWTI